MFATKKSCHALASMARELTLLQTFRHDDFRVVADRNTECRWKKLPHRHHGRESLFSSGSAVSQSFSPIMSPAP